MPGNAVKKGQTLAVLKSQVKGLDQKLSMIGINLANLHEDDITSSINVVSPISGKVLTTFYRL